MDITQNRIDALYLGIIWTVGGWYSLLLMTNPQKNIKIKRNHYIGLVMGIIAYILWWLKFVFIVGS